MVKEKLVIDTPTQPPQGNKTRGRKDPEKLIFEAVGKIGAGQLKRWAAQSLQDLKSVKKACFDLLGSGYFFSPSHSGWLS